MAFDVNRFIADALALSEQEVKFRDQGDDPKTGMDCVNLPKYLVKLQGLELPAEMEAAFKAYNPTSDGKRMFQLLKKYLIEVPTEKAKAGDLYLFRGKQDTRHIAIRLTDDDPPMIYEAYRSSIRQKAIVSQLRFVRARHIVATFRIPSELIA
ncbi:MAG TPA: NlpC/P60 family protein [Pyrinomonadaceae bacterium]|nr:NlpC/P60 family protein [Pyrinomonadaceae bacterium]